MMTFMWRPALAQGYRKCRFSAWCVTVSSLGKGATPSTSSTGRTVSSSAVKGFTRSLFSIGPRCISTKADLLVNDQICFPRLRVVDDRGFLGDYDLADALLLAKELGTDLVLVDPQVVPPLARLVDVDVYAEKQQEKEKELLMAEVPEDAGYSFDPALKVKGMRFAATIDAGDFDRKMKIIRELLEKGHRVEVDLRAGSSSPMYRGIVPYRMPRFVPKTEVRRSRLPPVVFLAKRILAEAKDVAKLGPYMNQSHYKGRSIMRLWPCSPEQAARARIPSDAELESLYGGYPQDPTEDPNFFQWKKRARAKDLEAYGMRRPGARKRRQKDDKDDE